jgi:hypothetical protein
MDKRLRFMSDLVGPMRVEPGSTKWSSRVATAAIVAQKLRANNPGYPAAAPAAAELMAQARAELIAESPGQARRGMRPVPRAGG